MHTTRIVFLILLCAAVNCLESYQCQRKKEKEMSKTKCVAGRRFYARLDKIPSFVQFFSENALVRPYIYPWLARIIASYAGRTTTCTGTLINDRYIITAQHCVLPPLEPQHLIVTLGFPTSEPSQSLESREPSSFGQYDVLAIILHPGYDLTNTQTSANDVALLKITPVRYTKTIYPIQLPGIADKYYDLTNTIAENAGWLNPLFTPGQAPSFSNAFQKLPVQIINNADCSNFNVYYKYAINPGVLCTTNVRGTNQGICTGNSGLPLMVENNKRVYNVTILVGIVSWNSPRTQPCAWQGSPVVYARIDKKLQWILDNTKDALYCRY